MRPGFLRGSRYSPGNMDRESLEALFVGRHEVMDDVLSRITTSVRSPEKHFILLVGPRGSGKTHFLALAYHRILDQLDSDRDRVAVALLNEEEWGVASYLDFLVRILRALAGQAPDLGSELDRIYERFSKDPAGAEAVAVEMLRQHTRGKTLLLLCENLVDLFHGLDEEGQKRWRAAIQEDGNWTIVATTPSLFAAVILQDNPFYGFFTIRNLERIDFDTGLDLLARKAVHEDKTALADFLRTPLGRARARAIHHLAAGNHRAYVVLSDFLDKESLEDLVGPFMHMVDDLTPYYQDRMRQLPPAQRKLVEFLCLEGKPATIKDISTPCLMSQQTAAKQIGELAAAGFIRRTRSGRNTFCELSEPLMRICIEIKDNRTQHFRLFVEFLRHWFTTRELERRQEAFRPDDYADSLDRIHAEEAVRCSLANRHEPFVNALQDEAKRCWVDGDFSGLAAIQETLVRDGGTAEGYDLWMYALIETGDAGSAIAVGREAVAKFPDHADLQCKLSWAHLDEYQFAKALSAIDRAIALDSEKPGYLCTRAVALLQLERFDDAIQAAQALLEKEPFHWHGLITLINASVPLGRITFADACARELLRVAPGEIIALRCVSRFLLSQNRLEQALGLVDRALEIDADDRPARHLRGFILFRMADYRRASEELRRSAADHPVSAPVHCRLAESWLLSGDFEKALGLAEQLLSIDPADVHAHYVRGLALIKLGRPANAISSLDELLPTNHYRPLLLAASCSREIGEYGPAERYLDRVAELQPDSLELWVERAQLRIEEGAFDAAAESATRVESLPRGKILGRLLSAQAAAATEPLHDAFNRVGAVLEPGDFESGEPLHIEAAAGVLTVSVRNFGPRYLPQGLAKLRKLMTTLLDEGIVGRILTDFLKQNVHDGFAGQLADWERALESLASSLDDLPDCHFPVEMLRVAVRYIKTGDKKHMLSLWFEQRQLLEDILPPVTGERAGRA